VTARLAHIVRHPLKAIGREELDAVTLAPGSWLPFDRLWAVAHENAQLDGGWGRKANFLRGVTEPALMAVTARLDEAEERLTLDHPEAGRIAIRPDDPGETAILLDWLARLWPADLPAPTGIYRAAGAHLTDVPDPWVSINNHATLRAVGQRAGQELSMHRWRGNLWIEGLAPWEEFDLVGQTLRIGDATLEVRERITRCKATMANPETGQRDVDTLAALRTWDHQDFGVYAAVTGGGTIRAGDAVEIVG
jgi:uncharacterized protein YcbX